ncbi:MAG: DUF2442 domain-containing protein [Myxococcota bacterium]
MIVDHSNLKDLVLELTFNDGSIKDVDFLPYVERGGVFEPLSDPIYFQKFFLDLNTVCWPNGADVSPERLYEIGAAKKRVA